MKLHPLLVVPLLAGLPLLVSAAEASAKPSFSCTRAAGVAEQMICAHAPLARADVELAALYKDAVSLAASDDVRTALRDEQREWLKRLDQRCMGSKTIEQANLGAESLTCLQDAYGKRIGALRDVVSPALIPDSVSAVDTARLDTRTTPANQRDFRDGAFSGDGRILALYVVYPDNEPARQVWLVDTHAKRLVAGTPPLGNPNPNSEAMVSSDVKLVWGAGTLYVRSEDEGEEGAGATSVYAASLRNGSSRLTVIPEKVASLFERSYWYLPSDADFDDMHDDDMLSDGVFALGEYMVWLSNQAPDHVVLKMSRRGDGRMPVQDLARGSWELLRVKFDRTHLIYPGRDGLMVFDFDTRRTHRIAGTIRGDLPVAYSAQDRMLAWASTRPCGSTEVGAETGSDPGVPHSYLCVATLPAF